MECFSTCFGVPFLWCFPTLWNIDGQLTKLTRIEKTVEQKNKETKKINGSVLIHKICDRISSKIQPTEM